MLCTNQCVFLYLLCGQSGRQFDHVTIRHRYSICLSYEVCGASLFQYIYGIVLRCLVNIHVYIYICSGGKISKHLQEVKSLSSIW
jgi:hypothetical protein